MHRIKPQALWWFADHNSLHIYKILYSLCNFLHIGMLCDFTYPVSLSTLATILPVGQVRNWGRAWRFVKFRQRFGAMQLHFLPQTLFTRSRSFYDYGAERRIQVFYTLTHFVNIADLQNLLAFFVVVNDPKSVSTTPFTNCSKLYFCCYFWHAVNFLACSSINHAWVILKATSVWLKFEGVEELV